MPMGGLDVQGLENAAASVLENCPMIVFNEDQSTHLLHLVASI